MTGLPEGLGRFELIVAASLALAAARERIVRGLGSEEEAREMEALVRRAAMLLVSEPTSPPPDAEWQKKHGESELIKARRLLEEYKRKGWL